ncbi:hypothetical protein E3J38_09745 [candidate division TA06 bacterium]|uniref:Uncharacterized protein n=1 Tax=candidate division TA06 bacterium TaxID=2250710 RepID=A0A523XE46_UNCT6|nr:MAG: hypothetical protein E3J62_01630 [candidate division TA06 bacterium]TET77537.1 MAG: hypothetical protein E3J38_09745 [candidate division TA06 bacterium]
MGRILLSDYDVTKLWSTVVDPRPPWSNKYRGLSIYEREIKTPDEQHAELGLLVGNGAKKN